MSVRGKTLEQHAISAKQLVRDYSAYIACIIKNYKKNNICNRNDYDHCVLSWLINIYSIVKNIFLFSIIVLR